MKTHFLALRPLLATAACMAMFGCSSVSDDPTVGEPLIRSNVEVSSCGEVSDPWADSLVREATLQAQSSFEDMGAALADGDMSTVRAAAPNESSALIDQVLAKYPNHCGAQFAKATLTLTHLIHAKELDTLVSLMNGNESSSTAPLSGNALFKLQAEDMPSTFIQSSENIKTEDPLTITRLQEVIESTVMPILDSTQAYLQNAMDQDNFAFRFEVEDQTFEIDRGEIGPALASLKLVRAYLIYFLAHELEISENGSYEWLEPLNSIEDMDSLTEAQTQALDKLTALLNTNSVLSTIKPQWKGAYAAIPSLLESALDDVQASLKYGIQESTLGMVTQKYDIYKVGAGEDYDVSPADLQEALDHSERIRKYLQGPVTITYNKGSESLTVDLTRFFTIVDGYQDLLPYHKINAYDTWNDVVYIDSVTETYTGWDGEPRTRTYYSHYTRGPFTFTNAQGKPTLGEAQGYELNQLVDEQGLVALSNIIIFPDPTFGGVFPGMTQAQFWKTFSSFKTIRPRTEQCEVVEEYYDFFDEMVTYEDCFTAIPENPSDLDLLTYYLK